MESNSNKNYMCRGKYKYQIDNNNTINKYQFITLTERAEFANPAALFNSFPLIT